MLAGWLLPGCGGLSEDAAASVNGVEITKDEVERRIALGRALISSHITSDWEDYFEGVASGAQGTTIPDEFLRQEAVRQLVAEEIDRQELADRGLAVDEAEAAAGEEELIEDYFFGDEQKMEEEFSRWGVTRDDLRSQVLGELYRQAITEAVSTGITVSDDDIRARYEPVADEFVYPEKRQIRQVVSADQGTAQAIAARIDSGENMTVIAREESIDPKTAPQAGRTGLLTREQFPLAVGDMAFSLPLNQLSAPFQSDLGWYLIRVEVINPESNRTLEEVREEFAEAIRLERLDQELSRYDRENREKYTVEYAPGYEPTKITG
ncbi:MAG: hypothetical protein C4534_07665 [Gaiellales bacterium]|nr:MAG: hypothetical protein C4534_07665 [Gaiellales bacterium]